jgi:hypothetical protein
MRDDAVTDAALEELGAYGPDLRNGLTSHAPMVVDALAALGRSDAVMPWLELYRPQLLPRPTPRERIPREGYASVFGREDRFADWEAFFVNELADAPWSDVVRTWVPRLAPAVCASAAHGVIRTGHAVRSLEHRETAVRVRELAAGLGYWAAAYQTLPTRRTGVRGAAAHDAIRDVTIVPPAERRFDGTIVSSLAGLDTFPPFAGVIELLDVARDPATVLSEIAETFARVFLTNAHDTLGAIVFVHAVTSVSALRSLLPYVDADAARDATAYAWQTGCGLYATFGSAPPARDPIVAVSLATLADRAIAHGDDHAIKFTEACLREDALAPSTAFAAATDRALSLLIPVAPAP